ncbi:DUF6531 domain-containing protein [uncultured Streptococcus sp.]|uniref:DUF6531 domain-containing protein n=1 Tax=uncultured Streptococcus sp. TaxID=83427 RepID=UPI0037DD1F52
MYNFPTVKGAVGVGRPVNPIHGLKFLAGETDFAFEGILPLVWSRSYYSDQDPIRLLGIFSLYQLASNTH